MPARPVLSTPRQLASRLQAERWLVDRARRTPAARRFRVALERVRLQALVRREGSVESALDRIVADATASDAGPGTQPGSPR